jgi:hypothetical protein
VSDKVRLKKTSKYRFQSTCDDPESIPYFLWDEPMTVAEFRQRLQIASMAERVQLLAGGCLEGQWIDTCPIGMGSQPA